MLTDALVAKVHGPRLDVPTIKDLATEVGISRVQMQRIVSGNIDSLKLKVGGEVIRVLRDRGFQTDVSDILEYRD